MSSDTYVPGWEKNLDQAQEDEAVIKESGVSHPVNASGGYYVKLVAWTKDGVTTDEAVEKAKQEAKENGWDPRSIDAGGLPSNTGRGWYSRSFWFRKKQR